jgi:glucokinase
MPTSHSTTRLAGPVLALDLGATNARAAVVSPAGELSARHAGAWPKGSGRQAVVDFCLDLLRTARDEHAGHGAPAPIALGVTAPGPIDPRSGAFIDPPNMGRDFFGFPIAPTLGEALDLPWAAGKDTNVAIVGERDFGAGEGSGDLIYLTISTGVGGAALTGGRPVVGPDLVGGELGHMTVDLDGPRCACGGVGHVEAFASGAGMAAAARAALDAGADAPELRRMASGIAPAPLTAEHVSRAADLGDPAATVIIERARRAVALAVVSIVNVFGPDAVILGGGITLAWGERLIAPARKAVAESAFRTQAGRVRIVQAALGDDVGLIGTVPLVASALPELAR